MNQQPLFTISWNEFISDKKCTLRIFGNVDKTDDQVYYSCYFDHKSIVITRYEGRWIDNSGADNDLAAKLGALLDNSDFLLSMKS